MHGRGPLLLAAEVNRKMLQSRHAIVGTLRRCDDGQPIDPSAVWFWRALHFPLSWPRSPAKDLGDGVNNLFAHNDLIKQAWGRDSYSRELAYTK